MADEKREEMIYTFERAALCLRTSGDGTRDDLLADVFDKWKFVVRVDPESIHRLGGEETLACARSVIEELS